MKPHGSGMKAQEENKFSSFEQGLARPPSSSWGPSYAMRDVCRITQLQPHLLRYWEENRLLNPTRTTRGHRRYRQSDVERILKIKDLFFIKKMRLEGVRKVLTDEARRRQKSSELPLEIATQSAAAAVLTEMKQVLKDLIQILK